MSCDLRLANCFDPIAGMNALPPKSVDVIITDPPYSEHVHEYGRRGAAGPKSVGVPRAEISTRRELGFEHLTQADIVRAAGLFAQLARRWVLVFCDVESSQLWAWALELGGDLQYVRTMAWQRLGTQPQFSGDRPAVAFDAIVVAHPPGRKRWNGGGQPGWYPFPLARERTHTTQKPVALMQALVRDFTEPGDLVLDPFAGSGSTAVAALTMGRSFVGWESAPRWHRVAARRLRLVREQLELPWAPRPRRKPRQERLAV